MQSSLFLKRLKKSCQALSGRIAFAEPEDDRILRTAGRIQAENIADVTLIGERASILLHAEKLGIEKATTHAWQIEPTGDDGALQTAAALLAQKKVQAVLAGAVYTTADVIRAAIGGVGLAPDVRTVSGAFMMDGPDDQLYLFADCGVVIAPTVRQLKDIAVESVRTWQHLVPDVEPVVAFLSYSTAGSAQHESALKMREAWQAFREAMPEIRSFGEMQFDCAMDAPVAARKAPQSDVRGDANCLIFPDLGAANIAYKITQRLAGYAAYGPILQGLAQPFSDLSRGSTEADIEASAYLNLIRA